MNVYLLFHDELNKIKILRHNSLKLWNNCYIYIWVNCLLTFLIKIPFLINFLLLFNMFLLKFTNIFHSNFFTEVLENVIFNLLNYFKIIGLIINFKKVYKQCLNLSFSQQDFPVWGPKRIPTSITELWGASAFSLAPHTILIYLQISHSKN